MTLMCPAHMYGARVTHNMIPIDTHRVTKRIARIHQEQRAPEHPRRTKEDTENHTNVSIVHLEHRHGKVTHTT